MTDQSQEKLSKIKNKKWKEKNVDITFPKIFTIC